jgi:CxxC motif-containing protein (DUF1111 family)
MFSEGLQMKRMLSSTAFLVIACATSSVPAPPVTPPPRLPEAPAGFDTLTNGRVSQEQHDADRKQFEEDAVLPALGPVYNARSCANCHETPVTGGSSQVSEVRTANGLVHDRAVRAELQEHLDAGTHFSLRMSTSLLGLGLVEDVPDDELQALARSNGGQVLEVAVLENPGLRRVGRFGWKCQHASLLSFAADGEFGEKGITNRIFTGGQKPPFEDVDEDGSEDIDAYARFMRATKAPGRSADASSNQVRSGERVFLAIGCGSCHVPTLFTAKEVFHPYGDFLLHDVGTGDGIVQGAAPPNKFRTAALWGLRARSRLLHDGRALTPGAAIQAHHVEAEETRERFNGLSDQDRAALLAFLASL